MAFAWFTSSSGRKFSQALAYSAVSGGFLIYCLPNTIFVDKYQEITQSYRRGTAIQPSPKVQTLLEATMDDLQISKNRQKIVSLYTGYGFDIFHAGSFLFSSKAVLGLPINFKYKSVEEFDTDRVVVDNKLVDWSTDAAHSLRESLIFSDNAKKFAIARELSHLEMGEPFANGIFTSAVLFMCYTISSRLNTRYDLYTKPRSLRACLYTVMSLFSFSIWVMCTDIACVSNESRIDKSVADISESYAKGGLEFYEKILKRNIALRALMGTDGEDLYTAYGNDQVFLRTKHMTFTSRRDYMKKRVEEYQKATKD